MVRRHLSDMRSPVIDQPKAELPASETAQPPNAAAEADCAQLRKQLSKMQQQLCEALADKAALAEQLQLRSPALSVHSLRRDETGIELSLTDRIRCGPGGPSSASGWVVAAPETTESSGPEQIFASALDIEIAYV